MGVFAVGISSAGASSAIPQAGNWEGTGSHGLPLSFALARRHGQLVATAIALGAPFACPANERDTEAVPLSDVSYAGPGAGGGSVGAVLSGRVPGGAETAHVNGTFSTATSGTFSVQVKGSVGCGWPSGTLTWQVHREPRERVAAREWSAVLTSPGIVDGRVTLAVAAHGRVVQSFRSSFTCQTATAAGSEGFSASPAYEFIRPGGHFYSPLKGNSIKHHHTLWTGEFTPAGVLKGTLTIYDSCTKRLLSAQFEGG